MKNRLKTRAFLSIPHILLQRNSKKRAKTLVLDHNDNDIDGEDSDGSLLGDYGVWGGSMYDLRRAQSDLRVDRRPSAASAMSFRSVQVRNNRQRCRPDNLNTRLT